MKHKNENQEELSLEDFSDLGAEAAGTRPCQYKDCKNRIPQNSEFQYCEVCRTILVRNTLALCQDPTSPAPISERDWVFHNTLNLMRPEEIMNAAAHAEWAYLNFSKVIKARQLELPSTKRSWKNLNEQLEEARGISNAPSGKEVKERKQKKEKKTSKEKLIKMFGSEEAAKEVMGEFDDLL